MTPIRPEASTKPRPEHVVPLESILCTDKLHRLPSRRPDYEAENGALAILVQALAASPHTILQTFAETMLKSLQVHSAGVSVLTRDGKRFYWTAVAGAWHRYVGAGTPRDFGPCGDVLDCNAPLLFTHWERRYPDLLPVTPLAEEALVIPFQVGDKVVGTIWAIAHDQRRTFDSEDLRQLESLSRFASAAYRVVELKKVQDSHRAALNLMEDAVQSREMVERLNVHLQTFADQLEHLVKERTEELEQSEDRLRALATELNLAEQRERKRLAADLHDYLAQLLVICRMTLGQAKRTGLAPRAEEFVNQTEDTLGKALTYCRTLMAELSPPVLQEQGLPAGLTWLAEHMKLQDLAVTVEVDEAGELPLPADRAVLLFQSVRELLINVAKHGRVKTATVRLTCEDEFLHLVVRDENGFDLAAMAPEKISPLSSKFGLFSIRERMKGLGGKFDIRSAPGRGTTVTLALPLPEREKREKRDETPWTFAPVVQAAPVRPVSKASRIRVLLVDDHTVLRQGLRTIVSSYNHLEVVGEAGDGIEAVELVQRLSPDVVVMDINMPNLDGIEATKRIKTYRPDIAVIGLSVNPSSDTEQKMKAAGAATYLTKESAVETLCQAIDKAISHKQGTVARQAC